MKWLASIKLSHKLIVSQASYFVLMLVLSYFSLTQLENINQKVWEIHSNWMPASQAAIEMRDRFNYYRVAMLLRVEADTPAEIAYTEEQLKKRLESYHVNESVFENLSVDATEQSLYEKSRRYFNDYLALSNQMLGLIREDKKPEALILLRGKMREKKNEFVESIDELVKINVEGGKQTALNSADVLNSARWGTYLILGLMALFEVLGFFYVVKVFSKSVSLLQRVGVHTCTSSNELAAVIHQQEATIEEQAVSSNEIVASAKEISATAKELSGNMNEIAKIAEETSRKATESQQSLSQLDETMRQMVDASNAISAKLAILNNKAGNINSVVNLIIKIADQTNLLSLNAAIEAEKAGEYGLGFSVVATEIRRLSDQTSIATFDIEQILKEMQSQVSVSVMGMDKFAEEIRRNVEDVRKIGQRLTEVIERTKALSPRFERIFEGMQAQNIGTDQITESMSQFSEGIHQTAESIRNSRQTVTLLTEASQDVQRVVKALA